MLVISPTSLVGDGWGSQGSQCSFSLVACRIRTDVHPIADKNVSAVRAMNVDPIPGRVVSHLHLLLWGCWVPCSGLKRHALVCVALPTASIAPAFRMLSFVFGLPLIAALFICRHARVRDKASHNDHSLPQANANRRIDWSGSDWFPFASL